MRQSAAQALTPDWAARPTAIPYAVFGDPQSLNLYGYVRNDPVTLADIDGHEQGDVKEGKGLIKPKQPGSGVTQTLSDHGSFWQKLGNLLDNKGWSTNAQVAAREAQDRKDWAKAYPSLPYPVIRVGMVSPFGPMGAAKLAKGAEARVSVYRIVESGETTYVGITSNLARRSVEHGAKLDEIASGLTRTEARGVEQALIEVHGLAKNGGSLTNKINSISRTNAIYDGAVAFGRQLIQYITYH
jgi:hypothetical protein